MRDTNTDYEAATFILRLWREQPASAPRAESDAPWRGMAVHVQSGTERGIQDMDALLEFLASWMQTSTPPSA